MRTHFIATMLTGVLVFLPLSALVFVVVKAVATLRPILQPLGDALPVDRAIGVVIVLVLCLLVLVAAIYALGLLAKATGLSRSLSGLDTALARGVPGYTIVKSYLGGASGDEDLMRGFRPVIAHLSDGSHLGFEVDQLSGDRVVVFLPDVPNRQSGRALVMPASKVERLDIPPRKVMEVLSFHGRGLERAQSEAAEKASRAGALD